MSESVILQLDGLKKSFDGVPVLKGLNLSVEKGEFLTLLGPSGCGKTTTLRIIAGLGAPDEGRVLLDGRDVTELPPNKRHVNTVFQNYALFPTMSVEKNIAYGLRIQRVSRVEQKKRVAEMLELVQLPGYGARMPNQLSGGQRQRVAIARAVILKPDILLLDEPLGALDLKLRQQMQRELKSLQTRLGITFIYITHDQEEALNMSDRIAIMREGQFEQIGTPEDIYERPKTRFASRFIGQGAVFEGEVASVLADGVCSVTLASGQALAVAQSPVRVGQKVAVSVHAERIHYALQGQSGFSLRAKVLSHRYTGSTLTTELMFSDGETLTARSDSALSDLPGAGEDVWVYWRAVHGAVIDEEVRA